VHYVWCSEVFDPRSVGADHYGSLIPPTSSPCAIFKDLADATRAGSSEKGTSMHAKGGQGFKQFRASCFLVAAKRLQEQLGILALRSAMEKAKANADKRASNLRTIVDEMRSQGITNVRSIAAELNARGILTPRGGSWHPTSAARLLARLAI
jgi:hypothetical protein